MKNTKFVLALFALFLFSDLESIAQVQASGEDSGSMSLKERYQEMLDKAETYTEYKVVKRTTLNEFYRASQDSLASDRKEIADLKNQVADQKSQISQLSNRITDLEAELAKSEELRESLSFLGLDLHKSTYHWIVWVLIGGLTGFGLFAYTSFIRSNVVTSKTKKEYAELEVEFDEHKKNAHEKQIKLARELQTERNTVEELKAKLKAKAGGKS